MKDSVRGIQSKKTKEAFRAEFLTFTGDGDAPLFDTDHHIRLGIARVLSQHKAYRAVGNEPYGNERYRHVLIRACGHFKPLDSSTASVTMIDFLPATHLAYVELTVR